MHSPFINRIKQISKPKADWIKVKHTHEPLVSQEVWDAVQRLDSISGKLPNQIFSMLIADYGAEKAAHKTTIANTRKALAKARDAEADIDRFAKLIQKYTSFEELDRFTLSKISDNTGGQCIWISF